MVGQSLPTDSELALTKFLDELPCPCRCEHLVVDWLLSGVHLHWGKDFHAPIACMEHPAQLAMPDVAVDGLPALLGGPSAM